MEIFHEAARAGHDFRYSPIFPAYLDPADPRPPELPKNFRTLTFLFVSEPHLVLGTLRPALDIPQRQRTFFSLGLASILIFDSDPELILRLFPLEDAPAIECWPISDGVLDSSRIEFLGGRASKQPALSLDFPDAQVPELQVYLEQIAASLVKLHASYNLFLPEEVPAVARLATVAKTLADRYLELSTIAEDSTGDSRALAGLKEQNAVTSALVELAGSLSYAVAQGTSGAPPILANRSPFPHHSLLGVATAVRALIRFTRYLERAFCSRSAASVMKNLYQSRQASLPVSISKYESGEIYALQPVNGAEEEFDRGGDFEELDPIPLVTYFSLRHGFKETRLTVTAASESLTAESMPQWTLLTLSHEIMHSRARDIFHGLFGVTGDITDFPQLQEAHYRSFLQWYSTGRQLGRDKAATPKTSMHEELRNTVLNFCCAMDRADRLLPDPVDPTELDIGPEKLSRIYLEHRRSAVELFVHFHDFYFTYDSQAMLYAMSLWASWLRVAAPVANPMEYLTRTLATLACGQGADPVAAYSVAKETLAEALDSLHSQGVTSPLFGELRRLMAQEDDVLYARFKASYYLVDQVRLAFASRRIARFIERLDSDPFAEGSDKIKDYLASIFVFGERGAHISPVRFVLASLFTSLTRGLPITDSRWLSAWNLLVVSSQGGTK